MHSNVPSLRREMNKSLVLNVPRQHGPLSRAQVAQKTNITRATVSGIVNDLLADGAIYESDTEYSSDGRKGVLLDYNGELGYGVAIDLGGTKISFALFDGNAELIARKEISTYQTKTRDAFITLLISSIHGLIEECERSVSSLQVIGIGTPGIVDNKRGIVIEGSPNLPEWDNVKLSERLGQEFGIPVILENDVRAALIGEIWQGKCKGLKNAALIALSTGIGSALLIDGNIIRGSRNAAGEIGYMLFERGHLRQDWSNKGCFEVLCSGSGLMERYCSSTDKKGNTSKWTSSADIFQCAANEDPAAIAIVDEFTDYLSIVVLNLVFTANPERIVLMGGLTKSADMFLHRLIGNVRKHTLSHTSVEIVVSDLKLLAPLYGMALLALNSVKPSLTLLKDIRLT
ncbi:ROK family transcriptional regulator [Paenibacillus xerothermodurans]|uniref:ROK family transcriptional regulator n=1 Tax=Paenibacillus xerothermodurans TaxID=1977292 RepID=A0A2W1NUB8_PAEXE|nr:ROK family transcriptional regulator [Paenibacillus xerothermodurans]PZE22253.1 ROK family transcriptional regulator [Paenibacillus xerothermodurans]